MIRKVKLTARKPHQIGHHSKELGDPQGEFIRDTVHALIVGK